MDGFKNIIMYLFASNYTNNILKFQPVQSNVSWPKFLATLRILHFVLTEKKNVHYARAFAKYAL